MFGFRNTFESEALPGGLPVGQNNPQVHALGLYTEQLTGTSFTRSPRSNNTHVWLYRTLPSVATTTTQTQDRFESIDHELPCALDAQTLQVDPNVGRWNPPLPPPPTSKVDFVHGLRLFGQAGSAEMCEGLSIYTLVCNASMQSTSVSFCDGDVLFVPQQGAFLMRTEMGELHLEPNEICCIPRGIKFAVHVLQGKEGPSPLQHRGYLVEVYNEAGFRLPDLGPLGANGLANPLHFEHPTAKFDQTQQHDWTQVKKMGGHWFQKSKTSACPFNVVAWRGNMVPCKYNLQRFNAMGTISFDHPDPSIFTVLTVPTNTPGLAALDFVIFPPRWLVATHTFRPPYFHRNCMCEFMGLISGEYDGKPGPHGFVPGGASLHNRMQSHGPSLASYNLGTATTTTAAEQSPVFLDKGLAFMFETPYLLKLSQFARLGAHRQLDYELEAWSGFEPSKL